MQAHSYATLSERLAFWQANDGMAVLERRQWHGRFTEVRRYRYINDVRLRDGDDALSVNWFAITVVKAKTGEQLYHNSFITDHRLHADNIADIAQAGRGRWKSENGNNTVLKTKGYHLEHNFGTASNTCPRFCSVSTSSLFCFIRCWSGALTPIGKPPPLAARLEQALPFRR